MAKTRSDLRRPRPPQKPWGPASKTELLELLSGIRAALLYGFFVSEVAGTKTDLIAEARSGGQFRFQSNVGELGLDLAMLAQQMEENPRVVEGNFYIMLEHQAVKHSYEFAFSYCKRTNQTQLYGASPALQFARVWRNVMSHGNGAVLTEWPKSLWEKQVSEVSWRDQKISVSDVGEQMALDIIHILQLQQDIFEFCRDRLV